MSLLHFDSVGGASGDMILAALLDLGVDRAWVEGELNKLGIGAFRLTAEATTDKGIRGLRLKMELPGENERKEKKRDQRDPSGHSHEHGLKHLLGRLVGHSHSHGHSHGEAHSHEPHAGHRGLPEIEAILKAAALPPPVLENCLKVFRRIAEAEARVHATTPEKIHFHEVGALDSIADIVGCNLCLHRLGVDEVAVAPLPIGRGTVTCAHGVLPLPAPATVEILTGFPVYAVDETRETVTPTGAALLACWKTRDLPPACGCWEKVGHGLGNAALNNRPNLLRAFLYREIQQIGGSDDAVVLECNLDDMTPELIAPLTPRLLEKGALDAFVTPVFMKKQRPGLLLTVLCRPESREALIDLLFQESTTFGIREHRVARTVLARHFETVQTPYGPVRIKVGVWKDRPVTRSPEYADCAAAAEKAGVPVKAVYQAALGATRQL
ncbi:MAG: nickel pincer cofactor biosynthesis protein LarC [Kiritimatiellia bacterium]